LEYIHGEPVGRLLCDKYNLDGLIEQMPFAQPMRKKGKWLPDNNNYITPHFVCSVCGTSQKVETVMYSPIWTFCPRCGADMRGEGDEVD
jgi:hypothetical protein